MCKNKLLCSTGALITRRNGRNYKLLEDVAPHIDCDGFEFMMYNSWYDIWDSLADYLQNTGIAFPVLHVEKGIGEAISRNEEGDCEQAQRLFEINCKMARIIGAHKLVLHLWNGVPSDRDIENNIEQYGILTETAKSMGLLLTVENVVCNRLDPLTHFEALKKRYQDVVFTFDVKFAKFHDQLDAAFGNDYRWLWEAVRHVHISDYAGGYCDWDKLHSLHPGEGNIDFKNVFLNLERMNYANTVTVESTSVLPDGSIDLDKLNASLRYIRGLMGVRR